MGTNKVGVLFLFGKMSISLTGRKYLSVPMEDAHGRVLYHMSDPGYGAGEALRGLHQHVVSRRGHGET